MVAKLVDLLDNSERDLLEVRARARSLPTMLRRHGPIPVLLFLAGKTGAEHDLGTWLLEGISSVLPEVAGQKGELEEYAGSLATLPLERYLLHWQTGVQAAGWLKRLVEARCPQAGPGGGSVGA
jgi:hypothetical protein